MNTDVVLQTVMNHFPDKKIVINQLFPANENFRDLCEDFVLCLNTIEKLKSHDVDENRKNLEVFEHTLEELELELISNFSKSANNI